MAEILSKKILVNILLMKDFYNFHAFMETTTWLKGITLIPRFNGLPSQFGQASQDTRK
jgi:hypothetical protein